MRQILIFFGGFLWSTEHIPIMQSDLSVEAKTFTRVVITSTNQHLPFLFASRFLDDLNSSQGI